MTRIGVQPSVFTPGLVNGVGTVAALAPNLAGGTITSTGTISLGGTINPIMIGTSTILGGTVNSVTMGTPSITGGSASTFILNGAGGTLAGLYGYDATDKGIFIGDGAAKQEIFTSSWKAFTPSWTNLTLGSGGVNEGKYCQIGKTIIFRVHFKLGTTPSVGALILTFPVAIANFSTMIYIAGGVMILDAGTSYFSGVITSDGAILVQTASGSYTTTTNTSSSVPMTWAATDELSICGVYEAS